MVCPLCLHKKSNIYNTRSTDGGMTIWRRRRCLACGKAFTTQENFDPSTIWKVKKDNKNTPYSRAKLTMSLLKACDHRLNQDAAAWYLFEAVEHQLFAIAAKNDRVISPDHIADAAAVVLKRFDAAAYIKYISHHQPAMDAKTLRKRLRRD